MNDRIILTVGAYDISPAWRAQLAPGGRLVLPFSLPAIQASVAFDERDGVLESASVQPCEGTLSDLEAHPEIRTRHLLT